MASPAPFSRKRHYYDICAPCAIQIVKLLQKSSSFFAKRGRERGIPGKKGPTVLACKKDSAFPDVIYSHFVNNARHRRPLHGGASRGAMFKDARGESLVAARLQLHRRRAAALQHRALPTLALRVHHFVRRVRRGRDGRHSLLQRSRAPVRRRARRSHVPRKQHRLRRSDARVVRVRRRRHVRCNGADCDRGRRPGG